MLKLDITGLTEREAQQFVLEGLLAKYNVLGAQITAIKARLQPAGDNKVLNTQTKPKPAQAAKKQAPAKAAVKVKGKITEEGRKRIAAAQKARWAIKKAAKATKTPGQRLPLVEAEQELAATGD